MLSWMSGQGWAHGTVLVWHAQGGLEFEPQYLEVKVLIEYIFLGPLQKALEYIKILGLINAMTKLFCFFF